jgi:hypothetical protein
MMDQHTGELTVVIKHDDQGRILEFVKTMIPIGTANELKEAASAVNERKKDEALLQKANAVLAQARAANQAAAAKAVKPAKTEKIAALPAPPVIQPVTPKRKKEPAKEPKQNSVLDLLASKINDSVFVMSVMKECAARDGSQIAKTLISKMLEPHETSPAGTRADVRQHDLAELSRKILAQLREQKCFSVRSPEAADTFCRAFVAGAQDEVNEFNSRKDPRMVAHFAEKARLCQA